MSYAGNITSTEKGGGKRIIIRRTRSTQSQGRYQPTGKEFIGSFHAVLERWKLETEFYSDPDKITSHQSFRAIVENAAVVLPLILNELRKGPSLLVWALDDAFPGDRPYGNEAVGDISAMTNAWVAWGQQHGRDF